MPDDDSRPAATCAPVDAQRDLACAFALPLAANPLAMWVHDLETLRFLELGEAADGVVRATTERLREGCGADQLIARLGGGRVAIGCEWTADHSIPALAEATGLPPAITRARHAVAGRSGPTARRTRQIGHWAEVLVRSEKAREREPIRPSVQFSTIGAVGNRRCR